MSTDLVRAGDVEIERILPAAMAMLPVHAVAQRRKAIVELMRECMTQEIDYGTIPGCAKPTLYQPGAQKLFSLFQLDPEFEPMPDARLEDNFILHSYRCTVYHSPSGLRVASGVGSCNSREEKYGMRSGQRKCPTCGKAAIITGKDEYGGGFLCFKKKGGCGAKFHESDTAITSQPEGKVANENIWEQENTIRKMAQKRSLIAACLNATGASDIFTQDVEDMAEFQGGGVENDKPLHSDGKEHLSTACEECDKAGVPLGLLAILHHGRIYVKTAKGEALHESYPLEQNAAPPSPEAQDTRPELIPSKDIPNPFKDWLAAAEKAKEAIGEADYYRILAANMCKHANEVKTQKLQRKVKQEWADCYRFQQAKAGKGAEVVPPLPPICPRCAGGMKLVAAGTSKAGKPYDAFYGCQNRACGGSAPVPKAHDIEEIDPPEFELGRDYQPEHRDE